MSNLDHPVKILQGGYIMGSTREKPEHVGREWKHPESTDLSIMDWNGKIVWSFPKAGMHHDFQLPGNPVGYWVPGMPMTFNTDKVLILSHKMVHDKRISDKLLEDDYIVEVDTKGNSPVGVRFQRRFQRDGLEGRGKEHDVQVPQSRRHPGNRRPRAGTGSTSTACPIWGPTNGTTRTR